MRIAHVALDLPLPEPFDYLAEGLGDEDIGQRVLVPFGRRRLVGIVVGFATHPKVPLAQLKPVSRVLREAPPLPGDILALGRFVADYYHCALGQVLALALPQALRRAGPVRRPERRAWRLTVAGGQVAPEALPPRAVLRRRLLAALAARGSLTAEEARALSPRAPRLLAEFCAQGWVEEIRIPAATGEPAAHYGPDAPPLTPAQEAAVAAIGAAPPGFSAWLLLGVTGSGKTEVYARLIQTVLAQGRQVLFLVPEINLTPQLAARLATRLPGARLLSLHSGLSEGERLEHWLAAQAGEADIVLGTRLSVFTPLPRLGLVVVDEEHDASYKQQEGVRYSARDAAVVRARQADVPIVLGSATPSLETWYNARRGRYRLLTLDSRAVPGAKPPAIRVLDLRREPPLEGLAPTLVRALKTRLARGEQSLLFINRRGYAPVLYCPQCTWVAGCHRCSARLVIHLREGGLRCHHCGHGEPIPRRCPQCGAVELKPLGQGTQRLEAALAKLLPQARVLRVDRDSTRRKNALPEMLEKVLAQEVDILVGTQMLAKGHDFPRLTLVGVLEADSSLYAADFRASERLFAQLTQVAGRAGRAHAPGEVLIQTAFPEHPLFAALQRGDYAAFADRLLEERKKLGLPPFTHQALLRAEAPRETAAMEFLEQAVKLAPAARTVQVYAPVPAAMPRRRGLSRAQLSVESPARAAFQGFLKEWLPRLTALHARQVRWAVDVDPLEG